MRHLETLCRLLLLPAVLASGGCMPGVYTSRPEIRGTVTEAATAEPIGNASVTVNEHGVGDSAVTVSTDARGTFRVPRARTFWVYWLMQGQAKWSYTVRADSPGFTTTAVELSEVGQMPPKIVDDVRLELSRSPAGGGE